MKKIGQENTQDGRRKLTDGTRRKNLQDTVCRKAHKQGVWGMQIIRVSFQFMDKEMIDK